MTPPTHPTGQRVTSAAFKDVISLMMICYLCLQQTTTRDNHQLQTHYIYSSKRTAIVLGGHYVSIFEAYIRNAKVYPATDRTAQSKGHMLNNINKISYKYFISVKFYIYNFFKKTIKISVKFYKNSLQNLGKRNPTLYRKKYLVTIACTTATELTNFKQEFNLPRM